MILDKYIYDNMYIFIIFVENLLQILWQKASRQVEGNKVQGTG